MKLKLGVITILLSTAGIIGLIRFSLNHIPSSEANAQTEPKALKAPAPKTLPPSAIPKKSAQVDPLPSMVQPPPGLSEQDKTIILSIASLPADKIDKELKELGDEISAEDLFLQLETGELSIEDELKARKKLERFAMLNFETKRRRYQDTDPQLKDPLAAHANSLLEIREALDDFDDDD